MIYKEKIFDENMAEEKDVFISIFHNGDIFIRSFIDDKTGDGMIQFCNNPNTSEIGPLKETPEGIDKYADLIFCFENKKSLETVIFCLTDIKNKME